ncbi:helix-hairpin-helix domain-containing protein [Fictibacillus sp. b24]|uniref:helix-hairpin-helix domain-containing protein n=1 Tax=Fictibacillus sp. b24 TaxID=3055863 RepID=UPI0025A1E8CD|nr:helix-hairpin-helix domain-containing protein [Fictibacillus sp. b24]MDM5315819.1 helix-hairpin-helix domain-containing protein [Fictibacillus sp. b24]
MEKIKEHLNGIIGIGIVFLLVISLSLFNYFKSEENIPITSQIPAHNEPEIKISDTPKQEEIDENKEVQDIMVDVQGSVKNPGVYKMRDGDRVMHAIQKAGGFQEQAELRSVNQAMKISDEMIVYVASKGEEYEVQREEGSNGSQTSGLININSADEALLQTLNGVGPAKAQSIITYREEHGPFTSIEQLMEVRGIGEKTIEQWKDKISFQ